MKHLYKYVILTGIIYLASACVTQKKKDDVKGVKLFFHNLTSKYNGYFNAKVLYDEAVDKLNASHQDNYNKILDIYPYAAVENPSTVSPDLDKAVEKLAVVITHHRPSHWADDSYLIIGKSQFIKQEYEAAQETFEYLTEVYNPSTKKKSPKDRKKAAEEARKEAKKARDDKAKEAKEERERKADERKKASEEAKKQREKDDEAKRKTKEAELKEAERLKEEQKKKEKEDLEKRNDTRKLTAEEAAKQRKDLAEQKRKELEERNEARRKANEERRKNQGKKPEDAVAKVEEKPQETTVEPPKEAEKVKEKPKKGMVKTGSNATPLIKEEDYNKYKKKGKPERYFLKHRPCYQEAMVWLARTYIERENYDEADIILADLDKNPKTFKFIRAMASEAHAYMLLKQQNYEAGIAMLEKAIKLNKKKKIRSRLAFVLAQVYQATGNSDKAYAAFDKVLDYGPVYEMEFNARLNMALNSSTSAENTMAILNKMVKDAKNTEFKDQIYFTLAQIDLKANKRDEALKHLKQSLASQSRNPQQKAEAYYLLAKLQFENEEFVESKNYFDSTQQVLPKNDPREAEVFRYSSNLRDIANNIEIITLQDSLLKISGMSDKEKKTLASNIKKEKLKAAEAAKGDNAANIGRGNKFNVNNIDAPPSVGNKNQTSFFGYFPDLIKKSKREFDKKWGADRKLEDNWRRSNKKSGDSENKYAIDDISSDVTDREVGEILKDVPKTAEDIAAAKLKIDEAMFQLGTLYHDKLKNEKKCVETLDKHQTRFPDNKRELDIWYYLYLAHTDLGNKTKAQEYFDKIQKKFPSSNYAAILKNPDAFKVKDGENVEKFYLTTYDLFKKGEAKKASERIAVSETTFGINNPLKAKFALLNALCVGRLQGKEEYIKALREVVAKFTGTSEEKYANEILRIIESGVSGVNPAANTVVNNAEAGEFKLDDDKLHYILIIFPQNAIVEDLKIQVSDYNSAYHRLENISISSIYLSTEVEIPMLVLRRFKNKTEALKYTEGSKKNAKDFIKGAYEIFAVTQDNYREILKQKSIDKYKLFYQKNYGQ